MNARVLLLLGLCGCMAPLPRLKTASGRPEVLVRGATPRQVRDALVERAVSKGWTLSSAGDDRVVFTRRGDTIGIARIWVATYAAMPQARLTCELAETPEGIRVLGRLEKVTDRIGVVDGPPKVAPVDEGQALLTIQRTFEEARDSLDKDVAETPRAAPVPAIEETPLIYQRLRTTPEGTTLVITVRDSNPFEGDLSSFDDHSGLVWLKNSPRRYVRLVDIKKLELR